VTLVEPGPFAADWAGRLARFSSPEPAYVDVKERNASYWAEQSYGDPAATSAAILKVVDSDRPPLRLFLERDPLVVSRDYESRLETWRGWQPVAAEAHTVGGDRG
jgi:hypothetical protein